MSSHDSTPRPPWYRDGRHTSASELDMRCSDAERTEITDALCRHFADGRLDEEELNERTAKALAAKTRRDLGPLLADLPPLHTGDAPQLPPRPRRHLPPVLLLVVAAVLVASTLPFAFMAWHAHWLIIGVVVAFLALRHHHHHHEDMHV